MFELRKLLQELHVPPEQHASATQELLEAGEILRLKSQRVIAWPQYAYDITALFIHHNDLPELSDKDVRALPKLQQRDASLVRLIQRIKQKVPVESKAAFDAGMMDANWLARVVHPDSANTLAAAGQLLDLADDLGMCFRQGTQYCFPALLQDVPDQTAIVDAWPVHRAAFMLGICLEASLGSDLQAVSGE